MWMKYSTNNINDHVKGSRIETRDGELEGNVWGNDLLCPAYGSTKKSGIRRAVNERKRNLTLLYSYELSILQPWGSTYV